MTLEEFISQSDIESALDEYRDGKGLKHRCMFADVWHKNIETFLPEECKNR